MGSATCVVAWEQSVELYDTTLVSLADTAKEGVVEVGLITAIAIAVGNDTRVDTGGVAVPQLEVDRGDRLAGVDVDDLDVKVQRNTLLLLGYVFTNELALDPVRALCDLRSEDARVVARKKSGGVGVGRDTSQVGSVRGGQDSVQVTGSEVVLLCRTSQSSTSYSDLNLGHTLTDGALSTHLLNFEATAVSHGKVVTACLQGIGTVSERALVSAQVRRTLSDLTSMLLRAVTRVSSGLLGQEGSSCESGDELHIGRCFGGGK